MSVLSSASKFLVKAFSWIAVFESSGKFQPTTSMKSLESVLEQLAGTLAWPSLHVVLLVRLG